jgi:hypothetical protein
VFKGKGSIFRPKESVKNIFHKLTCYSPIIALQRQDTFSIKRYSEPKKLTREGRLILDKILYDEKLLARDENQNLFVRQGLEYSDDQIKESRLFCKIVDGLIFFCRELHEIYPDATFVGLIRNPYALCESWMHRRKDIKTSIKHCKLIYERMLDDSREIPNYKIFHYEDLVANPIKVIKCLYNHTDLDLEVVDQFRMEIKKDRNEEINSINICKRKEKKLVWYEKKKINDHFVKGANVKQIQRLHSAEIKLINRELSSLLQELGYSVQSLT